MFKTISIILFLLSSTILFGSTKTINKKINLNKKILNKKKYQQKQANSKIKNLAKKIKKQEAQYEDIENKLTNLSNKIFLNKIKLTKVKDKVIDLEIQTKQIKLESKDISKNIVNEIVNRYSASIGVSLAKKQTLKEIIDKEIYKILLEESTDNIIKLNLKYLKSTIYTQKNKERTAQLAKYIQLQEKEKKRYKNLKIQKKDILEKLSKQHIAYQKKLKSIIRKQQNLQNLLGKLNILKIKEVKKEKSRQKKLRERKARRLKELARKREIAAKRLRAKKRSKYKKRKQNQRLKLDKEIDMQVRNIGSSVKGIRISSYKGRKTISPLKSYTITKRFGKYYDPIYKIELFNEALSMKPTKPNSKVFNIFKGKIVYAKKNSGTLENVVIIEHGHGLHTIYSHLDQIAPTLRIGKWIKKGFVVGRVSNNLMFQATKNNKYINPKDLFK